MNTDNMSYLQRSVDAFEKENAEIKELLRLYHYGVSTLIEADNSEDFEKIREAVTNLRNISVSAFGKI